MKINFLIKNNIWLLILISVIVSFIYPQPGLYLKPYLAYLLMILMFIGCLEVKIRNVLKQLRHLKNYLVLAIIHILPAIFVLLFKSFLNDEIFLGLILATVISSGMATVFLSHLYGGLPAEALVITTFSNIFSPITVPLLVLIFAQTSIKIDVASMSLTMVKLVIIPVVLARLVSYTKFKKVCSTYGDSFSSILLFVIMLGIVSPVRDLILSNWKLSLGIFVLASVLIVINFVVGFLLGSNVKEKITYGITASYKNFTLATVVALSLFGPAVALPVVVYAVVNNLSLIPLQFFVKKL